MAKKTVTETVKTAAKAVTEKAANATAAVAEKAAAKKTAETKEKKATVKESVAKAAETVKTTAKKTAAKAAAKTADKKAEVTIQYLGREVAEADVINRVVEAYKASAEKAPAIKKLQVYIKPEENAAYYVVNDTVTGAVALF